MSHRRQRDTAVRARVAFGFRRPAGYRWHCSNLETGYVGLHGLEQRVVRMLNCLNARANGAEAQVEDLCKHIEGHQLLEETQGEAEEGHRRRDQVTEARTEVFSLTAELRAIKLRMSQLRETNWLMEAELGTLRRQQQLWLQEGSQHQETRRDHA
ncbi:hypothetical protein Efla_000730 [Eimeria flavescens]